MSPPLIIPGSGEAERGHAAEGPPGLFAGGDQAPDAEQGQGRDPRGPENRGGATGDNISTSTHNHTPS